MPRPAPVLAPPSQSRRHARTHARSRPITHKLSCSLVLLLLIRPLPLPLLPPPSPPLPSCAPQDGPSARHSGLDWSDPASVGRLGAALGLEVVIEAGDALYVPALWFHYITSLTTNIQCNTRSGE
jgi:hypothetical protein